MHTKFTSCVVMPESEAIDVGGPTYLGMYSMVMLPPALRPPFLSCWPLNENASTCEEQATRAPVTKKANDFMVGDVEEK